jgi:hypothetical protein
MERTAETTVRTAQQGTNITLDYAVKAQEINAEILRKTAEIWIEGFRKQTELTQQMAEEVFKTSGDEGAARSVHLLARVDAGGAEDRFGHPEVDYRADVQR